MNIFDKVRRALDRDKSPDDSGVVPLDDGVESEFDQPEDEKRLAAFVKERVEETRQHISRTTLEANFLTNVAYLMGFDGVTYDTHTRQFKNIDQRRRLSNNRYKVNKILPTVQSRLAQLTKSPAKYEVPPKSNDTEAKDAARLALKILVDTYERKRFELVRQDCYMSLQQGGFAYIQTTFDPTQGKPMYDPDTGAYVGNEGDIRFEVLNCLEVFRDPLAKTEEDVTWYVKAKVRKLDYFRERYKERGHLVQQEDAWLISTNYDLRSGAMNSGQVQNAGSATNYMKNAAIELVYYERRSENHPNGRMVCVANGILLEEKELPIGEFDLVKFDDILIGGRFEAEAIVTHLRTIQDQYNLQRNRMSEWVRQLLAGKYLAARGAGIGQEQLDDETEVIEYDPVPNDPNGGRPQAADIPQIPAYAYKEIELMDGEFDFVSALNDVSRGTLPSASIPAAGIAMLQEADQTRISVQTSRNEVGLARVGTITLKYIEKYFKMERLMRDAGDGLEYAVKSFKGSDIKGNTDVIVIPGSTLPQSKFLRRQDIMNEWQSGLMGDPMDPKIRMRVHKMMEFGDQDEMWKKQALTEKRAKQVIDAIEQNDVNALKLYLSEFDNQIMHLDIMDDYRLSDKFTKLSDEQKQLFKWVMEFRLQTSVSLSNPEIPQQQVLAEQMVNMSNQEALKSTASPSGADPEAMQVPTQQAPPPASGGGLLSVAG